MPLCRINYLGIERSYVMWLDKILVMAWLNGCIISSAYCVYAAALLFAKAFGFGDVVPAVLMTSLSFCVLVLSEFTFGISAASCMNKLALRYGVLLAALPLTVSSAIGLLKRGKKTVIRYESK